MAMCCHGRTGCFGEFAKFEAERDCFNTRHYGPANTPLSGTRVTGRLPKASMNTVSLFAADRFQVVQRLALPDRLKQSVAKTTYQPPEPGCPLKGPTILLVIHPP